MLDLIGKYIMPTLNSPQSFRTELANGMLEAIDVNVVN